MGAVVIGMDPHKRSVTIEVMAGDETVIDGGRFGTDERTFAQVGATGQSRFFRRTARSRQSKNTMATAKTTTTTTEPVTSTTSRYFGSGR